MPQVQDNNFNGITVIERGNHPTPTLPVKLDFDYVVGGNYTDPYQVCSVYIFPDTQFGAPDKYVNLSAGSPDYGLVSANSYNFKFNNYKRDTETGVLVGFDGFVSSMLVETDYVNDFTSASGIFRRDNGRFSVVLNPAGMWDPQAAEATFLPGASGVSSISETNAPNLFPNTASGTGGYIDIWTVKSIAASKASIFVNTFKLNTNNTYAVTTPVEVTTTNKLVQRYVELGSKQKLTVHTFLTVDNEPIKQSLRNLMETGALIRNPKLKITKPGDGVQFDSTQVVKDWDGGQPVSFNNHDTISYLWDTGGGFGAAYGKGVFNVQVKFNLLDEVIYSSKFKIIVR